MDDQSPQQMILMYIWMTLDIMHDQLTTQMEMMDEARVVLRVLLRVEEVQNSKLQMYHMTRVQITQ